MSHHHMWEVFKLTVHCCLAGFGFIALGVIIEELRDIQTAIRSRR